MAANHHVRRAGGAGGAVDVDGKTVDELVASATHELLKSSDWALNMALCDMVTRDASQGAAVLKALKPRVLHKDPHVSVLGLAVLEGLVLNCPAVHPLVAHPEFLKELVKSLPKKVRDPQSKSLFRLDSHADANSIERNDRVLLALQSWANAFASNRQFPAFRQTYQDLLGRGVQFPQPNADEGAPVFTPPVKPRPAPTPKPAEAVRQFADVEARACFESAEVLDSMLTASDPSKDLRRHDLIPDLVASMRVAQAKLAGRVTQPNSDAVLNEILIVNDAMGAAIRYYEGLLNGTQTRKKPAPAPAPAKADEKKANKPHGASASAAGAAGAAGESAASPAKVGQSGVMTATPSKHVPVLAPPSSNSHTKGRHGSPAMAGLSPASHPAAAVNPPLMALAGSTPPRAGVASAAPAPAPAPRPAVDDLSDLFFGAAIAPKPAAAQVAAPAPAATASPFGFPVAPAAAPAPAPANGGVIMNPFAPTPQGAKAASVLDQFLGPPKPAVAVPALAPPQPQPFHNNPFAAAPAPTPAPVARAQPQPQPPLQPVLAAKYGVAAPAPAPLVAPHPIAVMDDDPFAAFAARDAAPAAAAARVPAPAPVANTTLDEENPFDQLARR